MQLENLTKEQFIRDFKDTLHQEQLIKVAKATPTEIFTAFRKVNVPTLKGCRRPSAQQRRRRKTANL